MVEEHLSPSQPLDWWEEGASLLWLSRLFSRKTLWVGLFQGLGVALMVAIVVAPRGLQLGAVWPQWAQSLFVSLDRMLFPLGVWLCLLPALLGARNPATFLMDTKFFSVGAKLSFWVYLVHYLVLEHEVFCAKADWSYSIAGLLPPFVEAVAVSLVLAFFAMMLIEIPFGNLTRLMRPQPEDPPQRAFKSSLISSLASVQQESK